MAEFLMSNPVGDCVPIHIKYTDDFKSLDERGLLDEILRSVARLHSDYTTARVEYLGTSFPSPDVFVRIPYLKDMMDWFKDTYGKSISFERATDKYRPAIIIDGIEAISTETILSTKY